MFEAKACTAGLSLGCEQRADHAVGARALPLYEKACDGSPALPMACYKLAKASEALGVAPSDVAQRYRRACEVRSFDACQWLTERQPRFETKTPALAEAFSQWCASGSARACQWVRAP